MGLFDSVQCFYPLPWPEAQDGWFQSYDTDAQYCESYEIRDNGELWYRDVKRKFREDAKAPIGFYMEETSAEWVQQKVTGEIEIHAFREFEGINYCYGVQFWFREGAIKDAVFKKRKSDNQTTNAEKW